jgi:hypothetical protein
MKTNAFEYLENLKEFSGKQVNFVIATDNCIINIDGKFRKHGVRYSFAKGRRKFVIEKRKGGSIWTWKGTHNEYWVELIESGKTLFEFKIPKNAQIQLDDPEEEF